MERLHKLRNDVQNRNTKAWGKIVEYVEYVRENKLDEFSPREYLGDELFAQIHTLPESISKLKYVKKIWLYGSMLYRVPPEIGEMESLEYFDPYTSYKLRWFPYEITKCHLLKDSRISTRALFGNYKNRMGFPALHNNPVRYEGDILKCSICEKEMSYADTNQLWITLKVATDIVPLLVNSCSSTCEQRLPEPPKLDIPIAHKGGSGLVQPNVDELAYYKAMSKPINLDKVQNEAGSANNEGSNLLQLIRKIWEK